MMSLIWSKMEVAGALRKQPPTVPTTSDEGGEMRDRTRVHL